MNPELPKAITSFLENSEVYRNFSEEVERTFGYQVISKVKEIDPDWKIISWASIDKDSVVAVIANNTCVDFYAFIRDDGPQEIPMDNEDCYGLFRDLHYDGIVPGVKAYRKEGNAFANKHCDSSTLEQFSWWTIDGPEYIDQLKTLGQLA